MLDQNKSRHSKEAVNKLKIKTLEFHKTERDCVVICQILDGEVAVGKVMRAVKSGTDWKISGIGFSPPLSWEEGRRALSLEPLQPDRSLEIGEILTQETER